MIYILCGKVASGKSTYAKELQSQEKGIVLSCDDMMLTLFDHCLGSAHDKTAMKCLQYLYTVAEQLHQSHISTIIDYGFWTKAERKSALDYFSHRNIPFEIHYLYTKEAERLQRLKMRNEKLKNSKKRVYIIEDGLLQRLDSKFEELSPDEIHQKIER